MSTLLTGRMLGFAIVCAWLPLSTLQAKTVTLSMDVEIDQVSPEDAKMYRVGGHDLDRVTYDDTKIDPKTHRVPVSAVGHYIGGHWGDTAPDCAVLDMSSVPYRLSFEASVTHGRPIVALFEGDTMRMVMLARPDFHMLIAGKYTINPKPLTDAEVAAPPVGIDNPDTMPIRSGTQPGDATRTGEPGGKQPKP